MAKAKKKFISQEYSTENKGKNLKEGTKTSRALVVTATSIFGCAIVVGISLIAFTVMFFFSDVKGTSMMMYLNATSYDTDSVVVNRFKDPKRGDVIVVNHYNSSGNFSSLHIKRLLAFGDESVHFRFEPANASIPKNHYVIEIDGVVYDNVLYPIHKYNVQCNQYDKFYMWQQSGGEYTDPSWSAKDINRIYNNNDPEFRSKDDHGNNLIEWNTERGRYEMRLPKNYIFYMGDNRGGDGNQDDLYKMSADSSWYGPQPRSVIVGTVVEKVQDKSAGQWFGDKMIMIFTFGIVRR